MGFVEIALWLVVGFRLFSGITFGLRPRRAWALGAVAGAGLLLVRFGAPLLIVGGLVADPAAGTALRLIEHGAVGRAVPRVRRRPGSRPRAPGGAGPAPALRAQPDELTGRHRRARRWHDAAHDARPPVDARPPDDAGQASSSGSPSPSVPLQRDRVEVDGGVALRADGRVPVAGLGEVRAAAGRAGEAAIAALVGSRRHRAGHGGGGARRGSSRRRNGQLHGGDRARRACATSLSQGRPADRTYTRSHALHRDRGDAALPHRAGDLAVRQPGVGLRRGVRDGRRARRWSGGRSSSGSR